MDVGRTVNKKLSLRKIYNRNMLYAWVQDEDKKGASEQRECEKGETWAKKGRREDN